MSAGLIAAVTVVYAGVAVLEFTAGRYGMGVVFSGYAFANIGLILQVVR